MEARGDGRKRFILQCASSCLNIPWELLRSDASSNKNLESFLDDPSRRFLQVDPYLPGWLPVV